MCLPLSLWRFRGCAPTPPAPCPASPGQNKGSRVLTSKRRHHPAVEEDLNHRHHLGCRPFVSPRRSWRRRPRSRAKEETTKNRRQWTSWTPPPSGGSGSSGSSGSGHPAEGSTPASGGRTGCPIREAANPSTDASFCCITILTRQPCVFIYGVVRARSALKKKKPNLES